ncbi:SDR family oxidoreductase [Micromonospora sp. NPDC000207]|uniref:SDR family oxidoreductase n=1 Tax=Micromonospora sp. NPDC000207 TaxID=3154246 RepID=UPI00333152ED
MVNAGCAGGVAWLSWAAPGVGCIAATLGVRITLCPDSVANETAEVAPGTTSKGVRRTRRATPTGPYAEPDDVAAAVAFLAGPGGRYITGATVDVDGGFTI